MKPAFRRTLSRWLLLAGFVLLIFGGKLALLSFAGSSLPSWDQWDGQSEHILRPWQEGRLGWQNFFQPHNEHRIVVTKIFTLVLCAANGQWDAFVETVANAALHTAFALLLLLTARRWVRGAWLGAFGALLVLLFTLPFAWENTLFGIQSVFYFMLLFSFGHLWLTLGEPRSRLAWNLGQACGLIALFTVSSGFFSSLAVLAVLGWKLLRRHPLRRADWIAFAVAVVCVPAGLLMKVEVPDHAVLKSHSASQFAEALSQLLAWPLSSWAPWALILVLPPFAFFLRRIFRSDAAREYDFPLLGLVVWWLLQCIAISLVRGGGGTALSPRYLDLLCVGVGLAFLLIVLEFRGHYRTAFAVLWGASVVIGLALQVRNGWQDGVLYRRETHHKQELHVRDYLRTGEAAHLLNKPWGDVPYPWGERLVPRLAPPAVQNLMPACVRRSVPLASATHQTLPIPPPDSNRPISWGYNAIARSAGAEAGAHWRSAEQPASTLPVLQFQIAGALGAPGHHLSLVVRSASGSVDVVPDSPPGDHWKTVNVFRPAGRWWIEASGDEPGAWFAFTEPVEVGRLSWAAARLLKHWPAFFFAAGALLALGLAGLLPDLRAKLSSATPPSP